jgi:hypothetical protein
MMTSVIIILFGFEWKSVFTFVGAFSNMCGLCFSRWFICRACTDFIAVGAVLVARFWVVGVGPSCSYIFFFPVWIFGCRLDFGPRACLLFTAQSVLFVSADLDFPLGLVVSPLEVFWLASGARFSRRIHFCCGRSDLDLFFPLWIKATAPSAGWLLTGYVCDVLDLPTGA